MSTPKVKVSVEHLRSSITEYIETNAPLEADHIATAIKQAVDAFDFDAAVTRICTTELEKFVHDAAAVYFRKLLTSPEAYAAVLETLTNQIQGDTE
jgi:hypothetical protein